MSETIQLWDAIRQMRKLSSEGKTFSFVHSTFNKETGQSDGFRAVAAARIRPSAKSDDVKHADHKIFYFDETLKVNRNCWQILILWFNDMKCELT
jgi:hypothetical protein